MKHDERESEYILRRSFAKSPITIISPEIAALGEAKVKLLVDTICVFDDFNIVTRDYAEHYADAFVLDGVEIWFWVDHFDESLTTRVSPKDFTSSCRRIVMLSRTCEQWSWGASSNQR